MSELYKKKEQEKEYSGKNPEVQKIKCPTCNGKRYIPCETCNKTGKIQTVSKETGKSEEKKCNTCGGQGGHKCKLCSGTGFILAR